MDAVDLMLAHQMLYQIGHLPVLKLFNLHVFLHIIFQDIRIYFKYSLDLNNIKVSKHALKDTEIV